MARRITTLLTLFMIIFLILQRNFGSIAASRPVAVSIDPPAAIPSSQYLSKPKPPSTAWFSVNPYKMVEIDAFRPTSRGNSPGVGHRQPPGLHAP
ncbi:hypothetical protein I3843_11G074400 [Carya illinoinensis]|nr:hypothetical protein I3843_11G074400 [Carya illinoinensis]